MTISQPGHRESVFLTISELDQLRASQPPVILDVRWALGRTDGRDEYERGHIPGAVYADLDTELAGPASPEHGRHPLPPIEVLQGAARRWGLDDGDEVIVYDSANGMAAARAWWLLKWAGVSTVRILDGGYAAWAAAGFATETGSHESAAGTVTLSAGHLPTIDADTAARRAVEHLLIDARAPERYSGQTEPIDPRAGHIPGAVNIPAGSLTNPDGTLLDENRLREILGSAALGHSDLDNAVYCGSGVTASYVVAALAAIGVPASLYPGSWSQWSNEASRPVATST